MTEKLTWAKIGLPDPATVTEPRARLEYIRDLLNQLPDPSMFNMREPGVFAQGKGDCGTPACIGGWVRALFAPPPAPRSFFSLVKTGEMLSISSANTDKLFFPGCLNELSPAEADRAYESTSKEAATVIDHYLQTGVVDWTIVPGVKQ